MAETAGGAFLVRLQGAAEAPLVLALHGFPDTAATFDGLGERLAAAGFRFAAVQMRGYAPSPLGLPPRGALYATLARDALAVAEALAPGRPFAVVGHDHGALATYALLRMAGERARCAVTLAVGHPAALARNMWRSPSQLARSHYIALFQIPRFAEWFAARRDFAYLRWAWRAAAAPGWEPPPAHMEEVVRTLRKSWPAPLLYYRRIGAREAADPAPLRQPVLFLTGESEGAVLPATNAGQERFFQGPFASKTIAGAGHFLHLERPEQVAAEAQAWLGRFARG